MAEELKVYLDHLIQRENLRYSRPEETIEAHSTGAHQQIMPLRDLMQREASARLHNLRKPDFQRATWAWTPDDCVSLLDSLVHEQVIPSIIMWYSPHNGYDYVLDGGHRLSVVIAWLNNDWGAHLTDFEDEEEEEHIKQAARRVQQLVETRIGTVADYIAAEQALEKAVRAGKSGLEELGERTFKRALFYRQLLKRDVGFHILWVSGDYERAEQSFLKINKSGKQLTEWETKLIENRNSSFARAVMSIANVNSAEHYWPPDAPDSPAKPDLEQQISLITAGVNLLHQMLFTPPYTTQIRQLRQPLLVAGEAQKKPYYLAEFLTIVTGGKGQIAQTDRLLERDHSAQPAEIIRNGWRLIDDARSMLENISGDSSKSLALLPALYFYTDGGRPVRSLLYGILYWLCTGTDQEILARKRLFAAHRAAFERVLLIHKEALVTGTTRKTGSGPDITVPTAEYFHKLLVLLIKHRDAIQSPDFVAEHKALLQQLTTKREGPTQEPEGVSRIFTDRQRTIGILRLFFQSPHVCGICDGMIDPTGDVQFDHIVPAAKGGKTTVDNQRIVHPFCNNNREVIERLRAGQEAIRLPDFVEHGRETRAEQLRLFGDTDFR